MLRHGVYVSEAATSVVTPVTATAGLPVVVGTAPIHLAKEAAPANVPVLIHSYKEAVEQFGYSDDWGKYTLCEFMKSHFALFAVSPIVFINVLDPEKHKETTSTESVNINDGVGKITDHVLLDTLVIKMTSDGSTLKVDEDYTVGRNKQGDVILTILPKGKAVGAGTVKAEYTYLSPEKVTKKDIVGGIDPSTGKAYGMERLSDVFGKYKLVPGLLLAPKWSKDPEVAAVMSAKASNINGHFRCLAVVDIPTDVVKKYTDVVKWKNDNNYTKENMIACWPMVKMGEDKYHLSTQLAGVMCKTDAENGDVPYVSPSNEKLQIVGTCLDDGTEVDTPKEGADYLGEQGVVTAINFSGGWTAWGNHTAAYPAVTDVKDSVIPVRRMFTWLANTLVLTFWQKVDAPLNLRLVKTIQDSAQQWIDSLVAREYILGGRVEFLETENSKIDLMAGKATFHVYFTPPSPAQEINFRSEYEPEYLRKLVAE